ncbi:MAG: DHH family phosphoesterase [Oscillospiraceae bacterium]|nr:DHH family phosphoesterase [Oscillospiraceae bacterium]MBQ7816305.1 DHH family phosphoesterase [Oscillospiraceae bacterium]
MNFDIFKGTDTVYITGHRNPDADSLVSAKIMQDILRANGINAQWVIWQGDKVDPSSAMLLEDVMDQKPLVLDDEETAGKKFLLVDHNDVLQSVKNAECVLAAIDHHSSSGQIENLYFSDHCCTALYIYMMLRESYDFSDIQREQIFRAFLSDSVFGRSSRYKADKDGGAVRILGYSNDYDEYFKKYFVPTDLTDYKKAFSENGVKSYKYSWAAMESGYIEAMDTALLTEYKDFVQNYNGNFLGIWLDYSVPKTYAFFKFGDNLYEYTYDCVASRAALIMPYIIKNFGK